MFTGTGNPTSNQYNLYINDDIIINESTGGTAGPNGWNLNNQYDQYSDCQISNLLCWNRVLDYSEILNIFNNFKGRFNL